MSNGNVRLVTVGAVLAMCGLAMGMDRPPAATPFGQAMPLGSVRAASLQRGMGDRNGSAEIEAAADHIVDQQCASTGGWGWPHDDCTATYNNITGPIATGLLRAYELTGDVAYLDSAIDGGDYDLSYAYGNSEARFSGFTAAFLRDLSQVSGNSMYADWAATEFFDELFAGTYGPSDLDTSGWIAAVQASRTGTWVNLRPWEFHRMIETATDLGNAGQAGLFLTAVLDGLNTLDNTSPSTVYSDILGLAGGVRGLAEGNVTSFTAINAPNHAGIHGMTTLVQLADYLAFLQNPDGSWYWHSNLGTPGISDEDTQTTAYAVLALMEAQEAGVADYSDAIAAGRQWLLSMQIAGGGFLSYPGGDENTEVEGEALTALGTTGILTLSTTVACVNQTTDNGTLTVTIDMSGQPVDVVGGQFFLSYDPTYLDFVSIAPGSAAFPLEVFSSVNEGAGTIDYAVGVPIGGLGTGSATTMAVITFQAIADTCTPLGDLVQFRTHTPPSRLTDELGTPLDVAKVNLAPLAIDITPPVITAPADVWLYADAGDCEALLGIVETFDDALCLSASQMSGCWYVDRYAPAAFESAFFDGDDRLHIGISSADSQANRPPAYASTFYNTQGRKYDVDLPVGSTMSGKVYIPGDWATSIRRTDMWGTTFDSLNQISGYPIIGFVNDDGASPRFRIFTQDTDQNTSNGYAAGWIDLGLPVGFSYDRWWTLEMTLTSSGYEYRLYDDGNVQVDSFTDVVINSDGLPTPTGPSVRVGNIIMQAYNFGDSYDVYWDDVVVGPTGPVVTDNCAVASVDFERSDNALFDLGDPFPQGDTTVTWTAIDACGNVSTDTQLVTVDDATLLDVTVQLQATVDAGPFDRCITFELTPTGGGTPVIVTHTMTFAGGLASALVEVPCGSYQCITARDRLHTLRRTSDDFADAGSTYVASFTGGDALEGGNLNDDAYIDILDFGIFIGQYNTVPGADTPCGYVGAHADISGDGSVIAGDYTFISQNFLHSHELNCAGSLMPNGGDASVASASGLLQARGPVTSISVDQLDRLGMGDLAEADLNGDGILDQADIAAFLSGARPSHLADIDRNGIVDFFDVLSVMQHLGEPAGQPYDINEDGWVTPEDLQFVIERHGMTFGD